MSLQTDDAGYEDLHCGTLEFSCKDDVPLKCYYDYSGS
jgi:hypothetical protein